MANKGDGDDYDPHEHREVPNGTTNMECFINLLKSSIGTGILAMPEAFKNCGIINGVVFTAIISIILTYALHLLLRSQYKMCKKLKTPLLTYAESTKIAFEMGPQCLRPLAKYMPLTVNMFLLLNQLGVCCVYVVFVSRTFKAIIDDSLSKPIAIELYMLAFLVLFVLMLSIRNMKFLARFSLVANLITLATFCVIGYYMFQKLPSFSDTVAFAPIFGYPLSVGTILFAISAIGVFVAAENNMLTPKAFVTPFGVLNVAMLIVTLLYIFIGFMGYWRYTSDTKSSITLNLPQQDILPKVINAAYAVSIFLSYGLQGYVAVDILYFTYIQKRLVETEFPILWEYFIRFAIVLFTFVLAATVPLLGLVISLVGALCISALGIMYPAIITICTEWESITTFVLVTNIFLFLFGILGLVIGTGTTIYEIIISLSEGV